MCVLALLPQILHEVEKAKKTAERKDYYSILGITRDATPRDVKQVRTVSSMQAPSACWMHGRREKTCHSVHGHLNDRVTWHKECIIAVSLLFLPVGCVAGIRLSKQGITMVQAYRQAAKRLHPDKSMAEGVRKEAAEKAFHDLAEAYEVLQSCRSSRCVVWPPPGLFMLAAAAAAGCTSLSELKLLSTYS